MKTSESIKTITLAFLEAQKKIEVAIKDETNPHFRNTFASHKAVIEGCKEQLNDNGIVVLQPIDGMTVETILIHTSGEWFSSSTPIVCREENNPQALGSAITYAKRYGLQSMVLLPAEDDDGNKASTTDKGRNVEPQTPKTPVTNPDLIGACEKKGCTLKGFTPEFIQKSRDKYGGLLLCYRHQSEFDEETL